MSYLSAQSIVQREPKRVRDCMPVSSKMKKKSRKMDHKTPSSVPVGKKIVSMMYIERNERMELPNA